MIIVRDDKVIQDVNCGDGVSINHFWYCRKLGLMKINFAAPPVLVEVIFDRAAALTALTRPDLSDTTRGRGTNRVWWAYEHTEHTELDGYEYAGQFVRDVPLMIYRDDFLNLTLPHSAGVALMAILKQRLGEMQAVEARHVRVACLPRPT